MSWTDGFGVYIGNGASADMSTTTGGATCNWIPMVFVYVVPLVTLVATGGG